MSGAPLAGRRILVTRRPEQASDLIGRLSQLGATVIAVPAIAVAAPEDPEPFDAALTRLRDYGWLILTSGNAVKAVADRLALRGLPSALRGPAIASVGPATTRALAERFPGRAVDLEPVADFRAEGLLAAFAERGWPRSQRCLIPQSDRGRDVLAVGLRAQGALVDVVVAYRTVAPAGFAESLANARRERIDLALFASPSAVEGFVAAAGQDARALPVAAIGPTTAEAARGAGLNVLGVASSSTIDDLVAVAVRCLTSQP